MKTKVNAQGELYDLHNAITHQSVALYYSADAMLGKKWVMSNMCQLTYRHQVNEEIPIFEQTKTNFLCAIGSIEYFTNVLGFIRRVVEIDSIL